MNHLFVYGTLLSTGAMASKLAGPRQQARVRGRMYRMPAGYPALTLGGDDWVHGEVVAVPDARVLELIDHYEGVGEGLYRRVQTKALLGLRAVPAWTYVMDDPPARGGVVVSSGRWRHTHRR